MAKELHNALNSFASELTGGRNNRYSLSITDMLSPISVLSIQGHEQLNQPWHYAITFTSRDKQIRIGSALGQPASLAFLVPNLIEQVTQISSLDKPATNRSLYGIVTEFSQLSVNKDEAHYRVILQPRLALFASDHYSAIYQNQSVVSVVEEVLRRHGFTGVDYRLELKDSYPAREFITQWQESDLAFIQRLLADVGIWFRFESHSEHHCDVLVLSDYEQGFDDAGSIAYTLPSGMVDKARDSVWDLQFQSHSVPRQVMVQDDNYRQAQTDMYSLVNSQPKVTTTSGTDYRYGEHFKSKGDISIIESGSWYATIRHQQHISDQIIISGKCNDYHLTPGQRIIVTGSPMNGMSEGIVILSTESYGDRSESYEIQFTAIPYNVLKPYRPQPLPWPHVSGTLPARVTSPDNDTYGYIDTQGRYRVKFDFDLKTWRSGEESLWVRLARPYAGDTYGFHFPLIDGTQVAIGFNGGNPDRPYIAHSLHDSNHPDHVTTANKHRNVLRTPANNKLRMDDKRGQEHIKLATEYGKTQLNIGHLVNSEKENRGHGFELRTDEWGAIRAGKGLYITTEEQYQAGDLQLKMDNAVKELEQAAHMVKQLNELANAAKAELADLQTQKQLLAESLKDLQQPVILNYAPSGIANITPSSIQQTAGENIIQTAQSSVDISAFKRFMVNAGNMISLFANQMGIKIFASKGNVDIQAQNDAMLLTSKQNMTITSTDSEVIITANKKLTLSCDGVAIILEGGAIKLIAPGDVTALAASFGVVGPANYSAPIPELPEGSLCGEKM
ncbi:type VI secretion system tip protein VgrG [Orbus wheelerorum]|uniref:type VI secretion system Vgr family protein n=1 Tax=Orbus wheelerorum TaxID=3074111 RepID=UPI00370D8BEC